MEAWRGAARAEARGSRCSHAVALSERLLILAILTRLFLLVSPRAVSAATETRFSLSHEWVRKEASGEYTVGITDYAQVRPAWTERTTDEHPCLQQMVGLFAHRQHPLSIYLCPKHQLGDVVYVELPEVGAHFDMEGKPINQPINRSSGD